MLKTSDCIYCFKSLGVPSRMGIYLFISEKGAVTVGDVVDHLGLTQPTISHHLIEMKKNGILISKKQGKEVYYSLNQECPHVASQCFLKAIDLPKNSYAK